MIWLKYKKIYLYISTRVRYYRIRKSKSDFANSDLNLDSDIPAYVYDILREFESEFIKRAPNPTQTQTCQALLFSFNNLREMSCNLGRRYIEIYGRLSL